jgi:23S rRNA (adenine2503-C2)-methyltransferase
VSEPPRNVFDLSRADLEALTAGAGQPRYRADQLLAWIHGKGVLDPAEMTDLPKALREGLRASWPPAPGSSLAADEASSDGTRKLRLALADGACTETVLIPEAGEPEDDEEEAAPGDSARAGAGLERFTQCLSTQVGCAFGCAFCRSGSHGFVRHLGGGEILAQRHWARRALGGRGEIVRTVVMGIGEPLHNVHELLRALRLLTEPRAGNVSPRRITVSTVGLPDGIRALGEAFEGKIGLAWSLHAADEATRRVLLPVASRRPVVEVVAALRAYPMPPRCRITVECVLVGGINDGVRHARDVARLLSGLRCKVNLIPFNPWREPSPEEATRPGAGPAMRAPPPSAVEAFQETLAAAGLSTFVRKPRGADILAACGQLLGSSDLSRGGRWDS